MAEQRPTPGTLIRSLGHPWLVSPRGASIRIFLVDGVPEGIRIATKSNWTGRALMSSRVDYPRLRRRPELSSPGIYILVGPSDTEIKNRVYVGEADDLVKRLDQHQAGGNSGAASGNRTPDLRITSALLCHLS